MSSSWICIAKPTEIVIPLRDISERPEFVKARLHTAMGMRELSQFMDNERNVLKWLGISFDIGGVGTFILVWYKYFHPNTNTGMIIALFLWAVAIFYMILSMYRYRIRLAALLGQYLETSDEPFKDLYDTRSPYFLVFCLFVITVVCVIMHYHDASIPLPPPPPPPPHGHHSTTH